MLNAQPKPQLVSLSQHQGETRLTPAGKPSPMVFEIQIPIRHRQKNGSIKNAARVCLTREPYLSRYLVRTSQLARL